MPTRNYNIREMTREDVDMALEWAAAEGWNPGRNDADCFLAADPNGFLVGVLGDEPIATISVVKYGGSFSFLGFYIVKPEYRGRGYGLQIWEAALSSLTGRTVGLDGVIEQQENYRKSGFSLAYRNIRYQGFGTGSGTSDPEIVPLSRIPFPETAAYDKPFFPDDRTDFLQCWIRKPEHTALGILRNGKLSGYGVLRPCYEGCKVGPLFADTPEQAERLFVALKSYVPLNAPIFLDIPEVNPAATTLAQRHDLTISFETARMYKGKPPTLPIERLFGVTTFELG